MFNGYGSVTTHDSEIKHHFYESHHVKLIENLDRYLKSERRKPQKHFVLNEEEMLNKFQLNVF